MVEENPELPVKPNPLLGIEISITYTVQGKPFPQTTKLFPKGINPLIQAREFQNKRPDCKVISLRTVGTDKRVRVYNLDKSKVEF